MVQYVGEILAPGSVTDNDECIALEKKIYWNIKRVGKQILFRDIDRKQALEEILNDNKKISWQLKNCHKVHHRNT